MTDIIFSVLCDASILVMLYGAITIDSPIRTFTIVLLSIMMVVSVLYTYNSIKEYNNDKQ